MDTYELSGEPLERLRSGVEEIVKAVTGGSVPRAVQSRAVPLLARYVEMLHHSSRIYGLISAEDAADPHTLVTRHILDCVAGAGAVAALLRGRSVPAILDLGSGAGLPGIPLSIVLHSLPDLPVPPVYLVERREKRVRFLTAAISDLALSDVHVLQEDAERPSGRARNLFRSTPPPLAVFRAYQQMSDAMLARLVRVFPSGTQVLAWKGRREEAQKDVEAIRAAPGLSFHALENLDVPFLDRERRMLGFSVQ